MTLPLSPSLSIVIPCYNAAATIAATIASVVAQTINDFEMIVIDDGSRDGSAELVAWLAANDARIRLIRQPNAGVSVARNRGAAAARAPIIAFLDADDLWHPEFAARMLAFMAAEPRRMIGFCRVRFLDPAGVPTGSVSKGKLTGIAAADCVAANPTTTSSNLVVRASLFERIGGFAPGLNHAEDQLWIARAVLLGALVEGFDDILVDYRTNPKGLSSDLAAMRRGWLAMVERLRAEFPGAILAIERPARAGNALYLARRALRLRAQPGLSFGFVRQALADHPALLWRRPWPTLPLLALACLDAASTVLRSNSIPAKIPGRA